MCILIYIIISSCTPDFLSMPQSGDVPVNAGSESASQANLTPKVTVRKHTNEETLSLYKRPRVEKNSKSKRPSILNSLDIQKLSVPDIITSPFLFTPCWVPEANSNPKLIVNTLVEISSSFSLILP